MHYPPKGNGRKADGCVVVITGGTAGVGRAIPLQSPYCAAKHALRGFTDSLRVELLQEKSPIRLCMVHLPAVNTPQFSWVKSRLPWKSKPVPPLYQPEVPARAIYWASLHGGRELLVGAPTYEAVWANKLAPGLVDRILAARGDGSRETREPEDPSRPNNLREPPPGDYGCHGTFDAIAYRRSQLLWLRTHPRAGFALFVAAAALIGLILAGSRSVPRRSARSGPRP